MAGLPSLTEYYYQMLGYDPFSYFYLIEDVTQYEEIGRQILCKELDNGRPIFTGNGNHAFVLDGYASDGNFHVNWGWDGRYDGWFKIYVSNDVGYLNGGVLVTYIGFAPPADKVHPVVREYEKGLVDCDVTEALTPGSQKTFESKFTVTDVEYGVDSVGLAIMDGSKISRIISKSVPIDTYVEYMSFSYYKYDMNGRPEAINYVAGYKDLKGLKTTFYVPDNTTSDVINYNLAMVYLSEGTWHLPNKYPSSLSDTPVLAEPLTIKVAPKGEFKMNYAVGGLSCRPLNSESNYLYDYDRDTVVVNGGFLPVSIYTIDNCRDVKIKFSLYPGIPGVPFHGDIKFELVRHEDQKTVFSTILKDVYVSIEDIRKEFELTIDKLPPGTYFPRDEGRVLIRRDGEQSFELLTNYENKYSSYNLSLGTGYRVLDKETAEKNASPYVTKYWWTADKDRVWGVYDPYNSLKHYLYPQCKSGYNVTVYNPSNEPKRIALLFTNFPGTDTLYHPATDTLQMIEKTLAPKETYTYTNEFESKKPGDRLFMHAEYQDLDENLQWFKPGVYELMARAHSVMEEEEVYKGKAHEMSLPDLGFNYMFSGNDGYYSGTRLFYSDTVATQYFEKFPDFKLYGFNGSSRDSIAFNYKNSDFYSIAGYNENDAPNIEFTFRFRDDLGETINPPVDSVITEIYDANKKLLYTTRSIYATAYNGVKGLIWNSSCSAPRPMGNLYIKLYFKVLEHVYPILGEREFFPVTASDNVPIKEYNLQTNKMNVANEIYDFEADDNRLVRGATTDLKYCIKNNSPFYNFNGVITIHSATTRSGIDVDDKLSGDVPVSISPYATVYGSIPVTLPADYDGENLKIYVKVTDSNGKESTILKTWTCPVVDNLVIVSVQPMEREYGEATVPEIRVSGGCPGKTFEWTTPPTIECSASADSPTGVYDVYVSGGSGNIPIGEYRGNILKIKPAKATIKPRDVSRLVGENNPTLEYDITGLKNGDMGEVLLYKPELACEATSDSKAGTYPITFKNAVKAVNYDFTVEDGTLTVEEPASDSIAHLIVGNYSREYGDDNPAFQIVIIPQEAAVDTLDVNGGHHYFTTGLSDPEWEEMPTVTVDATKASKPGTYPISVTGGKLKGYNGYEISEPGVLTVKKANLQVIARDTTLHYRNFWKPEFFEYIGFKNGENLSVIDKAPIPEIYQLLDENGRITRLASNEIYTPTGGEDNNYHLVFPQQEEYSPLRWTYGHLTVVPDTIQFSTGPLLTNEYGSPNGPMVPGKSTYDQFPSEELPEGYGVYEVQKKNGSWVIPINGRLDAGDYKLQNDTLFVRIGKDPEGNGTVGSADDGYVAFYVPTLRVEPVVLWADASQYMYSSINWFNMFDEVKFSYYGFKEGDDESVFIQKPTWRLAEGEIPLPGDHKMIIDEEGKAKNYTFKYNLGYRGDSIIHINKATPASYFSQFDIEYDGQYECELKWKEDMVFLNTYVGGTDEVKIEDYGIFECIDRVFPGRYNDYWETNGRLSKRYDYQNSFSLNYDNATGMSAITYNKDGDISVRLQLNLPDEIFENANSAYVSRRVNIESKTIDVNGDGIVDIADIVATINYILGSPSENFSFAVADLNKDDEVDIFDVMMLINIVMKQEAAVRSYTRTAEVSEEQAVVRNIDGGLMLGINSPGRFTAFQFDVEVADGMELADICLKANVGGHKLYYLKNDQNNYRVIGISMNNSTLTANGTDLVELKFTKDGDVKIDNITFVTPQEAKVRFTVNNTNVTAICGISMDRQEGIFDLSGRKIDTDRSLLPKGVYIINNKKVVIK